MNQNITLKTCLDYHKANHPIPTLLLVHQLNNAKIFMEELEQKHFLPPTNQEPPMDNYTLEIPYTNILRPIELYHEDMGNVLLWKVPINEPPYVGTPNDTDFPEDYYTHFTLFQTPEYILKNNSVYRTKN